MAFFFLEKREMKKELNSATLRKNEKDAVQRGSLPPPPLENDGCQLAVHPAAPARGQ
jgi:hypothetical protein